MSVLLMIALLALVGCSGAPPAGKTRLMRPIERPIGFVLDPQAWDCRTAGPCDQCINISHRVADVTLAIERRDGSIEILTRAHRPGAVVELCLPEPGRYAMTGFPQQAIPLPNSIRAYPVPYRSSAACWA